MRKRIISPIIAVALSVSFIPTSFSEGEDTVINNNGFVINAKDYSDSESSETIEYEINDDDENTEETIHDIESITKNIETDNSIVDTLTSSTTYSDICGRWEGYYTGTSSGNPIQRDVVFYIDSCDENGNIEGIFEFTADSIYGQYHYTGSIDFSDGSVEFTGDYWIVNPDNYSFAKFSGSVDFASNIISGTNDSNSERPFELKKVSDNHNIYSLQENELIGTWQGSYEGHNGSTVITRNVTLYIQNCDTDGNLEGIFQFDSPQEPLSSGAYKFNGTYSFNTSVINFKGTEWLDNPDNFSFGQFTGFSKSNNILEGYIDNEIDRTFSFKRVSDNIEIPLLDKDKIPTTWTGEYDGYKGDTVVRRTYKINILDMDSEGNIHGLAEFSPKPGIMYSASGSYRFSGKINFMTKKITFQGSTWIDYPDDDDYDSWSFAFFTAFISEDYKSFTGYVDDYSNRTIDMVA